MKYKLINQTTEEETLCDKVTIDGFDYYVSEEKYVEGELLYCMTNGWLQRARVEHLVEQRGNDNQWKKVIATTNPNIDVPKVADEDLGLNYLMSLPNYEYLSYWVQDMIKKAYNKSQETHPNSDDDMVEFVDFVEKSMCNDEGYTQFKTNKELLQIWKEQKPKIVYYGND